MITLTNSVINPAFIEEAIILKTGDNERCSDGGYYITVGNCHHWSPTQTAVVVYFSSGRTSVYGGSDANCVWLALHGTMAYVEEEGTIHLEGIGVNLKDNGEAWTKAPTSASVLLTRLVEHGYVDAGWLQGGTPMYQEKELVVQYTCGAKDTVMKATV